MAFWGHWPTQEEGKGTSLTVSLPLYSMERRISVVMTRQLASGLMVTSPVIRPTS